MEVRLIGIHPGGHHVLTLSAHYSGLGCDVMRCNLTGSLCYWQIGLECVSEVILKDWSWDQPCFIDSTQTERTSLDIQRCPTICFPPLFIHLSAFWWSLFLSPAYCIGSLMVILRMCGRHIGFFCRRSGSSQTSGSLTQLLNLCLYPKPLGPQSSTLAPDLTFTHEPKQAIPSCSKTAEGGLGSSSKCFLNGI